MTELSQDAIRFEVLMEAGLLEIGDGYRAKNLELGGDGPIFLRAGHVKESAIDFRDVDRFQGDLESQVRHKMSSAFDTIVTTKGNSIGRTSFVTESMPRFVYSPHLSYWRSLDHSKLHPRFLRCWARSPEFHEQLEGLKHQTDMAPYLSLRDQKRLQITLPSPSQQQAIGELVGAIDDKIDANRETNRTLESIAQILYRSWFIDFDPVVQRSAGLRPPNLADDVIELFPRTFEESSIGPIPRGWRVSSVPEAFEINPSRTITRNREAPYLEMKKMPTESAVPEDWSMREVGSGMRFKNGDTLMARITPCLENGKTAYVTFLDDDAVGWGSTEYIVIRSKEPLPLEFSYFFARDEDFRVFAIANMTGSSGRQRVPAPVLKHYYLALPDPPVAKRFGDIVTPVMQQIGDNAKENRVLAHLRDCLLPPLLSGDVGVAVADKTVESIL